MISFPVREWQGRTSFRRGLRAASHEKKPPATGGFSHTNINNTNNAWQNLPDSSDDIAKIVLFRGVCNRRFSVFFSARFSPHVGIRLRGSRFRPPGAYTRLLVDVVQQPRQAVAALEELQFDHRSEACDVVVGEVAARGRGLVHLAAQGPRLLDPVARGAGADQSGLVVREAVRLLAPLGVAPAAGRLRQRGVPDRIVGTLAERTSPRVVAAPGSSERPAASACSRPPGDQHPQASRSSAARQPSARSLFRQLPSRDASTVAAGRGGCALGRAGIS